MLKLEKKIRRQKVNFFLNISQPNIYFKDEIFFNWSDGSQTVLKGPSTASISNGSLIFSISQKNITLIVVIVLILLFPRCLLFPAVSVMSFSALKRAISSSNYGVKVNLLCCSADSTAKIDLFRELKTLHTAEIEPRFRMSSDGQTGETALHSPNTCILLITLCSFAFYAILKLK